MHVERDRVVYGFREIPVASSGEPRLRFSTLSEKTFKKRSGMKRKRYCPIRKSRNNQITSKSKQGEILIPSNSAKKHQSSILSYTNQYEPVSIDVTDLLSWKQMDLPECILKSLKVQNFQEPTNTQKELLPCLVRSTRHAAIAAATGSGKTLCYGIPIVMDIIQNSNSQPTIDDKLHSLILAPTRELAMQVKDHMLKLCAFTDIKILAIVGGISEVKQIRLLKRRPHIIVATPGRLWNLYNMNLDYLSSEQTGLSSISSIVLDEADRLFEHAHFSELKGLLEIVKAGRQLRRKRCYFLSATLDLQRDSEEKSDDSIPSPSVLKSMVSALGLKMKGVRMFDLRTSKVTVQGLLERRVICQFEEKDVFLYYLIETRCSERTLVFANSIASIKRLASLLGQLQLKPFVLHAKMNQKTRLKNLEVFSGCAGAVLLATDVAARGLDIPNVDLVIHYQLPRSIELYVHRSGRTARGKNLTGDTVLIVCPEEARTYQTLIHRLNGGKHMTIYNVDLNLLSDYKQFVYTTRKIEKLQHLSKRASTNYSWFEKMASECDIDIDEDLMDKQDHRVEMYGKHKTEMDRLTDLQAQIKDRLLRRRKQRMMRMQLEGKDL